MAVLHHYAFCPHSRFVRLAMAEIGLDARMADERPWLRDEHFLRLNPSGVTPVFLENEIAVPGAAVIAEYLDETRGLGLSGRRMMHEEVTGYLLEEKIFKRFGGGAPDSTAIRAARSNIRYHLRYIGYLSATRNWLAGDHLTYADLAAAAHLSCADYLGDVPWDEDDTAKEWYARVKSRPAFRTLLADRIPGMAPPTHYADLDF